MTGGPVQAVQDALRLAEEQQQRDEILECQDWIMLGNPLDEDLARHQWVLSRVIHAAEEGARLHGLLAPGWRDGHELVEGPA